MYYVYILFSSKSKDFYFGSTPDLKNRVVAHNEGKVKSTKPYIPWELVFYAGLKNRQVALDFERYLKSGSGKSFTYKRLVPEALKKDKLKEDQCSEASA
jgi:putative endonuclease